MNRSRFNGKSERRDPPSTLSTSDILNQFKDINVTFGKDPESNDKGKKTRGKKPVKEGKEPVEEGKEPVEKGKRPVGKRKRPVKKTKSRNKEGKPTTEDIKKQWRKKSIFFDLPYWESNLLQHNLDPMHIEKNVCDNVVYTLLNDPGKSKDNLKARKDLKKMGLRKDLWPDNNDKFSPSIFTMSNAKKDVFLQTLKNITVPDGYSSNISRCVDLKNRKLFGMKSHDCHVLMEQILPLAIRNVVPDNVTAVLVELCSFFRQLCAKSLSLVDLDKLQSQIILTLCHLEMLFHPSFFTIMVHLTIHLVGEAKLGGPVHYRWMYPIER